jgi:hypothetical protein
MDDDQVVASKPTGSARSFNNSSARESTILPAPSRLDMGSLVYVRYRDHVLFRNADPESARPVVQEAWGKLDYEDPEYIRLVVARYQEPDNMEEHAAKATGLVIVKSTILEMRKVV